MSYLNNLRMIFAGDFQADVSTVNNDVRHYDNATFEERFQDFQNERTLNGWWNPNGTGAFRLINCRIQAVYYQNGTCVTDASQDPAVGLLIGGSEDRVGGKIVDLDPQWQLVSQLWGLTIRLTNGENPHIFTGNYEPAAFRDLWFTRLVGSTGGDGGASAIFQSVLTDVKWSDRLPNSRFLQELKAATTEGLLSVRLTTFGLNGNSKSDRFTIGTVVGAIGPYLTNEPRSFVLGRRIVPANAENGQTADNVTYFDCTIDPTAKTVLADLSNALPITDGSGTLNNIGNIQLALLRDPNIQEAQVVSIDQLTLLGTPIPYLNPHWLQQTSGIYQAHLSAKELEFILKFKLPLALVKLENTRTAKVVIRETTNGYFVRADNFVHRAEPRETVVTKLFAAQYGQPLASATINFSLQPPLPDQGGGSPNDQEPPKATIPDINVPASALSFKPTTITNSLGQAELSIVTNSPENYRQYLDGQLYLLNYNLDKAADGQQQMFDNIVLLVHDEYQIPEQPTWFDDILPIFQQYGNLYPIMSKRLVNLSNYESVKEHRSILELAFSLDIHDPNFMPVTRDLSHPKQQTILKWLRQKTESGDYALVKGEEKPQVKKAALIVSEPTAAEIETSPILEPIGAKTEFYRNYQAAKKKANA